MRLVTQEGQRMSEAVQGYRVVWDADAEIAHVQWLPGSVCGLEEARAVTAEIRALGHGSVPICVDMREMAKSPWWPVRR